MGIRFFNFLLAFLILGIIPFELAAQSTKLMFTNLDVSDGLSHNGVFSILKDSRGFMWFGTIDGLNRYDGYSFQNYFHDPNDTNTLSRNFVNYLFEDTDGKIWIQISTNVADPSYDLNIYNPQTDKIERDHPYFHMDPGIPRSGNVKIVEDSMGAIWFVNRSSGLFRVSPNKKSIDNIQSGEASTQMMSHRITDFEIDSKGNYWVVHNKCYLERLDAKTFEVSKRIKLPELQDPFYWFFIDKDDDIWIWPTNIDLGLLFYDQDKEKMFRLTQTSDFCRLNENTIIDLVQDEEGLIWVGTDHGGINIIDKSDFSVEYILHNPANDKSLNQNILRSLYKDDQGIIWVGTFKKGISYYHPNLYDFQLYVNNPQDQSSLPFNDVLCFNEDEDENLWIGTDGGGLIMLDRTNNKFVQYKHNPADKASISRDVVVDIYIDEKGQKWLGTFQGGLNLFDGKNFTNFRADQKDSSSISEDRIWEIFRDSRGRMWLGTLEMGFSLFDPVSKKVIRHYDGKPENEFTQPGGAFTITEDTHGNLWIASADGIYKFSPTTEVFNKYYHRDDDPGSLSMDIVYDLHFDSRNWLWAATGNGLNLLMPGSQNFIKFYEKDGLPSSYLLTIVEDNSSDLWLGTSKGLSKLEITPDSSEIGYEFSFTNYDESNGLFGNELNENAAFKTSNGEMVFGGPDGFVIFNPEELVEHRSYSPIVFTNLQILDDPVPIGEEINGRVILDQSLYFTEEIELKHKENLFTIDFASLDYFHPEKIRYKYILEGFKDEWLQLAPGTHSLTFTNLDPGSYLLRVRSMRGNKDFGDEEKTLRIVITPPFYRTLWFQLIAFLSLIIIAILWYLQRILSLKRQQILLQNQVDERTSQLKEKNEALTIQSEKLNEANALLEERQQQVEEQTEELMAQKEILEDANNNLRELNSTKDRFFSIIAHDIKNPFQTILGFSELLRERFDYLEEEKKKSFADSIYLSASSVYKLLENLLQWARSQTNQIKVKPAVLEIDHLVTSNIQVLEKNAAEKKIQLHFSKSITLIYADADMISTVLRNLISNAIKFTPSGGNVYIGIEEKDDIVWIIVRDTGIGIDKEKIEKLFSVEDAESTQGTNGESGTGLGLILCKEFVRKNNGEIRVESKKGEGSTFSFSVQKPRK